MDITLNELVTVAGALGGAALVAFRTTAALITKRVRAFYVAAGAAVGAAVAALAAAAAEAVK